MPATPDTILEHANSIFAPLAMLAGMRLDVFSTLKHGSKTAAEMSGMLKLKAAPARLGILLDALVAAGLLEKQGDHYINTPEAQSFLVKGDTRYMGGLANLFEELWPAGFHSAETLKTGIPQAAHDYNQMDEAGLRQYYAASFPGALKAGGQLAELVDFSKTRSVLDIGGGSGGVAIGLVQVLDKIKAEIFDFPSVVPFAQEFIADNGLGQWISVQSGNIVNGPPEGIFDAAVLRNVVQVLSPEEAAKALGHVGTAVASGGRIVIWGWARDDDGVAPKQAALHNLVFLNFYDAGVAHTESQYRDWLARSGFSDFTRRLLPGGVSLIEAVKKRAETS